MRVRLVLVLLLAGLLAVLAGAFWGIHRPVPERLANGPGPEASHQAGGSSGHDAPPAPDVSLQVNADSDLEAFQGTPLILSVRLANPSAMIAQARNDSNRELVRQLEADLKTGSVHGGSAETRLSRLRPAAGVSVIQLTTKAAGWESLVRFEELGPDGARESVRWPFKLIDPSKETSLTLDATRTGEATYVLDPSAAAAIPLGVHRLIAAVEVSADARTPGGYWRGRTESEPVTLHVVARPERLTAIDEEKTDLQFARYFKRTAEWERALESARKALTANPHSIPAHILAGEIAEAQGDGTRALDAFQAALVDFHIQHPHSSEPPVYLIDAIGRLIEVAANAH